MSDKLTKIKRNINNAVIMIVDDEEIVLQSLHSLLSLDTDYEVLTFLEPNEALKELNKRPIDMVMNNKISEVSAAIDQMISGAYA